MAQEQLNTGSKPQQQSADKKAPNTDPSFDKAGQSQKDMPNTKAKDGSCGTC